ncbi:72ddf52e-7113-4ff0-b348-42e636f23ca1 [Thermothielavioides terrestris]|uniref:72ddf52e-7113-4ff0-b348-42e636f23ca1 n=1 Tax=Thermothielavioides terrestris TaxID=2587410 RepID=A0A3S4EZJ9_9PEZI|nr:72ddf52e-7113-4ff0-b348-42e636f23ca1 [Thermothielavioides terrestris]
MEKGAGTYSPLWHQALEKYLDELQGSEDYEAILQIHSLDDLLYSLQSIPLATPGNYPGLNSVNRLAPRLKFVDDFAAVLAVCFGADAALTAAVWGSIRLILSHASSAAETFQDVLDMLEELSLTLPRLQVYEKTLPLNQPLQQALVDVYCEIICFYARTINFLRRTPHLVLRKSAWRDFRNDFSRTIMRIKRMSSAVESQADIVRMQKDEVRYKEVLELLNAMQISKTDTAHRPRYNNIPFAANPKFSGREGILERVHQALSPETTSPSLKSIALFGMGGVGKTQIAVQYAHRNIDKFDAILWVAADNTISIGQSFRAIAEGLGLLQSEEETKDAAAALLMVRNWLSSSIATTLAAQHVQVDALSEDDGSKLLLKAIDVDHASPADVEHARAISRTLGGLPLALAQIGGFITLRKLSLHEVLPLYERYSTRIHARKAPGSDYQHTLSTVWDVSFDKLTETSTALLRLLSFFDPDGIPEDIFLQGSDGLDEKFAFLFDELDLGDACEELIRAALLNRTGSSPMLTIHRLVQDAARTKLSEKERMEYFDAVIHMLCWGFPDHSSSDIGHQIAAWSRCEKCLPHVNHIAELAMQHKYRPGDKQKYLYEREMYFIAKKMVTQAISTFEDTTTLAYASAIDLGGLIDLDLARPGDALEPFKRALEIRKTCLGPEDPFIAYSLNNIALAYTEMNQLDLAYTAHQEAIRLRLQARSDRIGNSYSNMASLLLRMGRADEAEDMLARCPALKDFTDETFLATGNPRFSGDMVLLSRIRRAQGRRGDALRLASKALAFRRFLLGNRLKTCDSLFDVACLLLEEGHEGSAV